MKVLYTIASAFCTGVSVVAFINKDLNGAMIFLSWAHIWGIYFRLEKRGDE